MTSEAEKIVSEAMQEIMTGLDNLLKELTGRHMGISLCVFNSEAGGRINYVSNCDREEVKIAWLSMIKGWEEGMPDIPAHEVQ